MRLVGQAATRPDGLHLRTVGGAGEQVQAHALPVGVRAAKSRIVAQPDRDPGEDLVPEPPDQVEEAESRSGYQHADRVEPSVGIAGHVSG